MLLGREGDGMSIAPELAPKARAERDYDGFSPDEIYEMGWNDLKSKMEEMDIVSVVWCKDCKYYELNSWANVNGIPLIVAHHICKRWGDGCKTARNGFCFMGEKVTES